MKLLSAHVKLFKSIIDSGVVEVEDGVTCLVGKNESGKTAFLEALYRLNPVPSGHRTNFTELYDYPRRLRAKDKTSIPTTVPITAVFQLEAEDIEDIEKHFGKGALTSDKIVVSKNYSNVYSWEINLDEKVIAKHLGASINFSGDLLDGVNSIEELREKLAGLEEKTDSQDSLLDSLKVYDLKKKAEALLSPRLPKFVYFDNYNILPGRFSIPYVQAHNKDEASLESGDRTALSLLRLAGVESSEFLETEYEARKAALEAAAAHITDEVFEFWSQNKDLRVDFDADFTTPSSDAERKPPFLEIRIWNNRHRISLNFGERSTGFVWFFSFLAYFSEFRSSKETIILLLDEPGLGLHASAQNDLLRYIDERLAPENDSKPKDSSQVIYTTHSPFMIKEKSLERTRTVEDKEVEGTKVSDDVWSVSRDTVFPLQAALGYELSKTLFLGPDNLVVDGPSDILYLEIVSNHLSSMDKEALDPRWVLVPAGGIDKIPAFIALLGSQLNVAVLLDVSSRGNQRIEDMVKRGILDSKRLIPLTEFTSSREADIEDLFDAGFYLGLLKHCQVADIKVKDLPPGPRIVWQIEKQLGKEYSHYKPAAYFQRNQGSLLPKLSDSTLERFENLFKRINKALS